jgi:hypothetical protein
MQAKHKRGMLAGVDYRVATSHFLDSGVEASVVTDIFVQRAPKTRWQHRSGEHRHEPVAVYLRAQAGDPDRIDPLPSAEARLADLPPEITRGERPAASAALVVDEAPPPQVNDLAEGARSGQLAQEPLDKRAPAAAKSGQVDDRGSGRLSRAGDSDIGASCGS